MDAPGIRDKRLGDDLMRLLDAFASAEETGAESASLAEAVIDMLSDVSPYRAGVLERALRDAYRYAPPRVAHPVLSTAERLAAIFAAVSAPPRLLPSAAGRWLRLLHPDGYIREGVLKVLDQPPPAPVFLAALLLCLNDHVPQVREAAGQYLGRLGNRIPPAMISAVLPYAIGRGFVWRTAEDRGVFGAILARDDVRASIKTLLMTGTEGLLPRFFRDLLVTDIADPWLVDLATCARHTAVRTRSVFVLLEGKVDSLQEIKGVLYAQRPRGTAWYLARRTERAVDISSLDIGALIAACARDPATTVRKAAAQGLVRHHRTLPDTGRLLDAFGDDKSAAVRDRLDFIRRQRAAG